VQISRSSDALSETSEGRSTNSSSSPNTHILVPSTSKISEQFGSQEFHSNDSDEKTAGKI